MIKAAFFDIDGTLLSYNTHRVSPETIRAVNTLRQMGVRTFISSGRPVRLIPEFPFAFDGYVTMNGGYCFVLDPTADNRDRFANKNVLLSNPIPISLSDRWLQYVETHHIATFAFTADELFVNCLDDSVVKLQQQLDFPMPAVCPTSHIKGRTVYQFIAMLPASEDTQVLDFLPGCRLPRWHPAFSDLIPANSSKAEGIASILAHYGINRQESVAFGDGSNDIEMLEYCGIGVAMGNANDDVKTHADYVTTDVDNDGIARALTALHIL